MSFAWRRHAFYKIVVGLRLKTGAGQTRLGASLRGAVRRWKQRENKKSYRFHRAFTETTHSASSKKALWSSDCFDYERTTKVYKLLKLCCRVVFRLLWYSYLLNYRNIVVDTIPYSRKSSNFICIVLWHKSLHVGINSNVLLEHFLLSLWAVNFEACMQPILSLWSKTGEGKSEPLPSFSLHSDSDKGGCTQATINVHFQVTLKDPCSDSRTFVMTSKDPCGDSRTTSPSQALRFVFFWTEFFGFKTGLSWSKNRQQHASLDT